MGGLQPQPLGVEPEPLGVCSGVGEQGKLGPPKHQQPLVVLVQRGLLS